MIDIAKIDARLAALIAALLLYGVAGSPTPDHPGWVEAVVGLLLLSAARWEAPQQARPGFLMLFVWGMSVPVLLASYAGHQPATIMRDVIPFLFLCLPLFFHIEEPGKARVIFIAAFIVGVLFAARVLGQGLGFLPPATELLYLANSPLVLMAAIIGLGGAGYHLYERCVSVRTLLFFAGGLICLLAMLIDVQRGTITAVIVSLALIAIAGMARAPRRMVWPLVVLLVLIAAGWETMISAWHSMATKTALVGVNMRWQEALAVWERLNDNTMSVVLGLGWGAAFDSPAVEGMRVPYTHSLLTYMFLKTGLAGIAVLIFALAGCIRALLHQPLLVSLALGWAILIPVFFYASYKSLDFGVVLLLALLPLRDMRDVRLS